MKNLNFEEDMRKQIINILKRNKVNFAIDESIDLRTALTRFLNFQHRIIHPTKRKVKYSDRIEAILKNKKIPKEYIKTLKHFKNSFEKGINMNCHLSANIYYSNFDAKRKEKVYFQSRDYLLDDWGIHHFHLNKKRAKNESEMRGKNGNRSEYLLFAKITEDTAYFIDIKNHNDKNIFSDKELLTVIDQNWSFLIQPYHLPELECVSELDDVEIAKSRKKGSLILININEKVYMPPGGGLTSAGTNIFISTEVDSIFDDIKFIKNDIIKYISNESNINLGDLKLCFLGNGYLIRNSNLSFKKFYNIPK